MKQAVPTLITRTLPMGEWTPDEPDLGSAAVTAQNVIPWPNGYKSFPQTVNQSTALNARFQGGGFARDTSGNVYNFAGTVSKLYQQTTSSVNYSDATRLAGGAYATATLDWWELAQWGSTVIATNGADVPQVVTLGGANFAALGGTPPTSRHIAIVRDFVVMGNVTYGGNTYPNRLYWSAINNSADWTIAAATQCDIQDLQGDGGWVQKIIGGEYGLVFQERAVWKMTYVGSPVIFQFDLIERNRGAYAAQSVIGWGNMVFFLADDGFYMIVGGAPAVPIGAGKVDVTFLTDLRAAYAYRVSAAIDPTNKLVMWAYPGTGSTDGTCNKILIYNWAARRWSRVVGMTLEGFMRWAATGYSLEALDAVSASLDALSDSLDSRAWVGGTQNLACFQSDHKAYTFTGTAMDAIVDTGEVQLTSAARSEVANARPLTDGNAASVAMRTRNRLADTPAYAAAVTQLSDGDCPQRSNAFYHSARVTTTGAFNFIQGVELAYSPGGQR